MKGPWQPDLESSLKQNALHVVLISLTTPDSDFLLTSLLSIGTSPSKWVHSTSSKLLFAVSAICTRECNPHKNLFNLEIALWSSTCISFQSRTTYGRSSSLYDSNNLYSG